MKTKIFFSAALFLTLITAAQAQTIPAYLPADGLVAWWPFNGNANDSSGNNFNLFNTGANLHPDRFGNNDKSYWVGNGGTLTYTGPSITGGEAFTFSFWMKTNQNLNELQDWIFSEDGPNENSIPTGIWFTFNPMSKIFGIVHPAVSYAGVLSCPFPGIDEWHHVVVTGPESYNVYIDGQLASTGGSQYFPIANQITFRIGAFNGAIDDFATYNRKLSYEEIQSVYEGSSTTTANPTACNPFPSNLQNGLVGYWPFCGNANDESGNGNDGTVNGATLTEDRFGVANAAYDFDGVDDFIELTENVLPANNNSYSIHFWASLNKDTSRIESYTVFDDRDQNSFGSKGRFIVSSNTDETYLYQMGDNEACFNNNFQSNLWTSIACIYDNENDVITVYKDGNLSCTSPYGDDSFYPGLRKLLIGKGKSPAFTSVEEWKGQIDDIGIWNRVLTAEEVQELYTLNACTFTIYDTVTVNNYVTIYDTVSVSTTDTLIINTLITGVQPAQENTFLVYPNPTGSQITINNGNVSILGGYTMRISNSIGQEVYNQNITQTEVTLDLSNWGGNGLYVLYILDPQGEIIAVKQIVLQ